MDFYESHVHLWNKDLLDEDVRKQKVFNAETDGFNQGFELGMEKGLEQGSYQKAIEMAKFMIEDKMSVDAISKYTDLPSKIIKKLQKNVDSFVINKVSFDRNEIINNAINDRMHFYEESEGEIEDYKFRPEALPRRVGAEKLIKAYKKDFDTAFDQGVEKGLEQGVEQKTADATNSMIEDKLPIDAISKYTGLALEKVKDLQTKANKQIEKLNKIKNFYSSLTEEEEKILKTLIEEAVENRNIDIAKSMIEANLSEGFISKHTGLSIDEINKLEND